MFSKKVMAAIDVFTVPASNFAISGNYYGMQLEYSVDGKYWKKCDEKFSTDQTCFVVSNAPLGLKYRLTGCPPIEVTVIW